ncbi:hypothetical protein BH18ACT2_BH18ACT2_18220 [soil metagenome]
MNGVVGGVAVVVVVDGVDTAAAEAADSPAAFGASVVALVSLVCAATDARTEGVAGSTVPTSTSASDAPPHDTTNAALADSKNPASVRRRFGEVHFTMYPSVSRARCRRRPLEVSGRRRVRYLVSGVVPAAGTPLPV